MIMYISELNEYLSMLIEEYNNDYLDHFDKFENTDFYKRNIVSILDTKILQNVSSILKKIHNIEKNNSLYNNIKFNEFICYVMVLFKDINIKNTTDLFKRYGFALRKIYIQSHNLQDNLIIF